MVTRTSSQSNFGKTLKPVVVSPTVEQVTRSYQRLQQSSLTYRKNQFIRLLGWLYHNAAVGALVYFIMGRRANRRTKVVLRQSFWTQYGPVLLKAFGSMTVVASFIATVLYFRREIKTTIQSVHPTLAHELTERKSNMTELTAGRQPIPAMLKTSKAPGIPVAPRIPNAPGIPVAPRIPNAPGIPVAPGVSGVAVRKYGIHFKSVLGSSQAGTQSFAQNF